MTDHKPLESVFNKPTHATSIRQAEDGRDCARGAPRTSTDETAAEGARVVPRNGLSVGQVCIHMHLLPIQHARRTLRTPENDGATGGPWRKVSVDFCGLLANGDLALVFHCQYSRYPVIEFVGSSGAKATIPVFKRVFDTY